MRRTCTNQPGGEPWTLFGAPGCGAGYDDAECSTICPHEPLHPTGFDPLTVWGCIAVAEHAQQQIERKLHADVEAFTWPAASTPAGLAALDQRTAADRDAWGQP